MVTIQVRRNSFKILLYYRFSCLYHFVLAVDVDVLNFALVVPTTSKPTNGTLFVVFSSTLRALNSPCNFAWAPIMFIYLFERAPKKKCHIIILIYGPSADYNAALLFHFLETTTAAPPLPTTLPGTSIIYRFRFMRD